MAVADDAGLDQPHRPGGNPRRWPAGSIRPGGVQRIAQRARNAARRDQRVEQERASATGGLDVGGQSLVQKPAQGFQPARR